MHDIYVHPKWFYDQDNEHKQLQIIEYFRTLSSIQVLGPQHYDTHTSNTSLTSNVLYADRKFPLCNLVDSYQCVYAFVPL